MSKLNEIIKNQNKKIIILEKKIDALYRDNKRLLDEIYKKELSVELSQVYKNIINSRSYYKKFLPKNCTKDEKIKIYKKFYSVFKAYEILINKVYLKNNDNYYISSLDEFKNAVFSLISENILVFFETSYIDIVKFHNQIDNTRSKTDTELAQIKNEIMDLCGIEKIKIEKEKTIFNDEFHEEYEKISDDNYQSNVIIDVLQEGFIIKWANKIIRKAGVSVNYNFS